MSAPKHGVVFHRPALSFTHCIVALNLTLSLCRFAIDERSRRLFTSALFAIVVALLPSSVMAQAADSTPPQLGLGASSAISVHAGVGQIKHAALGREFGGTLDLGYIGMRRVRLGIGLDYLAMTIDRPDSLNNRERGDGYVFTAFADVTFIPSLSHRLSPYGGLGFGVDAVGTTISNEQVGAIYNTNVFDLHAQLGAMLRVTPRQYVSLEARGTGARVVRRLGVRLGYILVLQSAAVRRIGVRVRTLTPDSHPNSLRRAWRPAERPDCP